MIQESDIVHILSDHSGQFVSGESLANLLGCSRAAVWKKIRHLREKGYPIEAVTNKGYRYMDTHEAIEYRVNTILSGQGDAFFKVKYFFIKQTGFFNFFYKQPHMRQSFDLHQPSHLSNTVFRY